jgi:hypothetical protein
MNLKLLRAGGFVLLSLMVFVGAAQASVLGLADVGGGSLSPPVIQGNYMYVGTGATITTWDMTDPTHPIVAARTNDRPSQGPVRGVAIAGGYLYAVWQTTLDTGGITIFSLADPAHPTFAAEFDDYIDSDYKRPTGIVSSGNYLYVGDADNGVVVVLNATDPLAPTSVGTIDGVYEFDSMAIHGNQLLTSGTNFIGDRNVYVVDISAPAMPVLAGQTSLDGFAVLRAVLADGYAIGVGDDLMVYDLHDPSNITQIFDQSIDQATQGILHGNVLYLLGGTGIQVWDFTTPGAPTLVHTVATDVFGSDQALDTPFGPLILTHTDRGLLLGVNDPQNPVIAASFTLPFGVAAHAAGFDATHVYFAQEDYGLGVLNAATLASQGRYDADLPPDAASRDMEDVAIDGGRAYLSAWGYGVLIADLSNPANPTALGGFEFPFASTIEAHGNRVYVASATNGGIFKILDVSDPTSPTELGELLTSQTYDLTVRGNYAYLVDGADFGDGGLRVVDVSDPTTPTVTGQYTDCMYASGVDVSADGNTTYIACSDGSLHIVDTTNKASPTVLGTVTLASDPRLSFDYNDAHSVVVSGTTAYVGHEYGVDEIDISNPQMPVATVRHNTGYFVAKLSLAPDGRVFAFAAEGGTYVYVPLPEKIFANGFEQ